MASTTAYKLVYFAGRGRAEAVRLAFAYGGIAFEDARFSGPELFAKRAAGELKPPYSQFPYLEVNGTPIAQSATILRFVAKKAGLYPADELVAAQAESVVEQMNDVASAAYPAVFNEDAAAKEKAMEELKGGKLAKLMAGVVAFAASGKPFLFGEKACIADMALFATIEGFASFGVDFLPLVPELGRVYNNVAALPELSAYFAKRAEVEAAEKAAAAAAAAAQ